MDMTSLDETQKRALLAKLLQEKAAKAGPRKAPLSHAQARLWFIDQMQPGNPVYTITAALRLAGNLDQARLQQTLNTIRGRHEALRTQFVEEDGIPQQVIAPSEPLVLEQMEGEVQSLIHTFAARPFDLATGPLIRCALIRENDDCHVLVIAVHHIIADYRSLQVMIQEFAQIYSTPDISLPSLAIQYADYAVWQNGRSEALKEQLAYWEIQLTGVPALSGMPTDFPRPAIQTSNGARHSFTLSADVSARIETIAQTRGMTPYMVLMALFQLLHHRYSGAGDICIGTTVSNRDRAELQGMVGYFVNTLVIRNTINADDTLDDLLDRTRQTVLGAMANQEAPFEQVVDQIDVARSLAHTPVFQSMFNLHEKQPNTVALPGLTLSTLPAGSDSARFDLALDMYQGDHLSGVLEYNTDLFAPDTITRMVTHFETLIEQSTSDPACLLSTLDIRSDQERAQLTALNQTDAPCPEADLATLIEQTAVRRSNAQAVICNGRTLNYAQLNAQANQLAHLIGQDINSGDRVAVCLPRSEQMIIALLAVLKQGATYIPLDPKHPADRLQTILEDSEAKLVLCADRDFASPCPLLDLSQIDLSSQPDSNPLRTTTGEDLAYVIFTSGTTGRPKGVPIQQKSLANLLTSMATQPGLTPSDTLVSVTTPAFDIAGLELFLPLLTGATLVIADEFAVMDDLELARLLRDTQATVMQATPTTWRLLSDGGWRAPEGFKMLCGGEALDPALAKTLLAGSGELWNVYGPTETTIWSTCARITQVNGASIPLGNPIANTTVYVLDEAGLPCPTGVAGELFIGGIGLSPGYLNRPDLTQQAFVPNPFGPGTLYRTGDSVKRTENGDLMYLGRLDFQVKLRGFRIELAEIESVFLQDPAIEQAVVALQQTNDEGQLVAYCRTSDATQDLETRLRAQLTDALPTYMIPTGIMFLDRFPLNANGKIDRKALPLMAVTSVAPSDAAPATPTESFVARIWGAVLNRPIPGRTTDFFAAGGHSLLAMQMIARLPLTVPRATPLRLLFENPVLRDFAAALDDAAALSSDVNAMVLAIPRLKETAPKPLSYAQTRQWALTQIDPDSTAYNLPAAMRLHGPVDLDRLDRAFTLLIARHDILRSAYPTQSGKAAETQIDHPIRIERHQMGDLDTQLQAECNRRFDLEHGPLLRLCAWGGKDTVLLLVMHHIISDALSVQLVMRELIETYVALSKDTGFTPTPLPVQYADFAAWEQSQDMTQDLDYWQHHLADAPPLLELPTDYPRSAQQGFQGDIVRFSIPADRAAALRSLGQTHHATPFMVMLTGFAALLGRYSTMSDLVIGTPVAQRPHPDLEHLVGLFVNTLALRLPGTGETGFAAALDHVRETVLTGFEHQNVPFEQVVERLSPDRSQTHNPIFQAMFQWKTRAAETPILPDGLKAEPLELGSINAKVDIALAIEDSGDGFACRFEFRTDLYRRETIEHMALAFETLLERALSDPSQPIDKLPLLHPVQATAINAWNNTTQIYPETLATLHDMVSAQTARDGAAIAVRDETGVLSYAELDARSDTLAADLQSRGITHDTRVGIALPRTRDLITAILAVLKTGAAYVPLDPNYPADRISYIAQDADLSLILTGDGPAPTGTAKTLNLAGFWDTATPLKPAPSGATGDDLAYLIYTSGSTGLPKGVALAHRNAVSFVQWAHQTYSRDQLAGVLASTSVCFDLSIFEIFATLTAGGTVLLVQDLFGLPDAPFVDQVTLINTVPTPMTELLRLGPLPANARTINLAGEPLPPSLAEALLNSDTVDTLWNLYGPSEDTTYSTGCTVQPDAQITIGRPIANTAAYVLDPHGQELPPGVPGELWLAGDGVAQGYWQRPDLTAERFLANPFDTDRAPIMYRTGDRVRRLADGSLDYLGRSDRQVKVRGFRIEPGEVETAILRYSDITGAAVGVWHDTAGHARLTAWIETLNQELNSALSAFLTDELPAHMVPSLFVPLTSLPRLPNGKLDRNALPDPQLPDTSEIVSSPPSGPLEQQLAQIWQTLLGRPFLGRDDNFFAVGGDSILAIQVVAQARQEGLRLSPRDLFQYPTIAALAAASAGRAQLSTSLDPVEGDVALGAIQHWLLERNLPVATHWNQALVFKTATPLDPTLLQQALTALAADHDALRARFTQTDTGWAQTYQPVGDAPLLIQSSGQITEAATKLQASFDFASGPLWGAVLCDHPDGQRLAFAAHHLLVDGVSWRIILNDLHAHYQSLIDTGAPADLPRSNGMGDWVAHLSDTTLFIDEIPHWSAIDATPVAALPTDLADTTNLEANAASVETVLDETLTAQLLTEVPNAYPVELPELLTTALALSLQDWSGESQFKIEMESHGRPDLTTDLDLSRSVGWFTGLYPIILDTGAFAQPGDALMTIKNTLRSIPNDGIGYGVLKYLHKSEWPQANAPASVRFNYLGQTDGLFTDVSLLSPATETPGPQIAGENPRDTVFDVSAIIGNGRLRLRWTYPATQYHTATVQGLAEGMATHLRSLIHHCLSDDASGLTPADFPDMDFGQDDLDDLLLTL